MNDVSPLDIAVIGMACYFPEAYNIEQYWYNLSNGISSIKFHTDEELLNRGVDKKTLNNPNYVKASPNFTRTKLFDASFFNINPGEASIMDPQRRLFIENCWQALEDAGYDPGKYAGKIGVFGSAGINLYIILNLLNNPELMKIAGPLQILTGNEKDGLPTQTSYILNLTGPSVNVNTACSSSLVAIHLARQSLLFGDSDMVLAGGSALIIPENVGYLYEKDSILSHDGYCRAFDDDSDGTLWGSGSGAVLLKRLGDAIRDKDNIRAVIKGSAINNDGSNKVGFTAPSIKGQTDVILQAYASSDISPESINYIEAHGTGTKIGDPIEVAALIRAFGEYTKSKKICGLGSVKTNIGHVGAAAGIASFIKAVLALENKKIPPSLNFKKGNSIIDFENSPFYIVTELCEMKRRPDNPLRVGVSSLGVGGTNAHIILEEALEGYKSNKQSGNKEFAIVLSARSERKLNQIRENHVKYLENNKNVSLDDYAYTLQSGRANLKSKLACIAGSVDDAIGILKSGNPDKIINDSNYKDKIELNGNELNDKLFNWFKGDKVDWDSLYKKERPGKISLPVYPFEEDVYWVESNQNIAPVEDDTLPGKNPNMDEWIYCSYWSQTNNPPLFADIQNNGSKTLIFVDDYKIGREIGEKLESRGEKVVFVYPGEKYKNNENVSFEIDLEDSKSYIQLVKDLLANNLFPDSILHFFGLNGSPDKGYISQIRSIFSFQKYGLFSLLFLIKAINANKITKKIRFISFVSDVFDINGNEAVLPEKSGIMSAIKVVQQEYPNFNNRVVEIDSDFMNNKDREELLVNEILSNNNDIVCSYRGNKRWILFYQRVNITDRKKKNGSFKEKGVYFVLGGLTGGIPALYEYIIKKYQAKLIVIDDPTMPKEEEWNVWLEGHGSNEINSLKIKTVKRLKSLGVEYIDSIDIFKNKKELEKKIFNLETQYGKINGVIHAAGGYAAGRIALLSESEEDLKNLCLYNLGSISGSFVILNEIFKDKILDFKFVWTSLSTVLAGQTFYSYCAADSIAMNSALKANKYLSQPWSIVNWDSLESEWFEDLVEEHMKGIYLLFKDRISEGLITTDEANECLESIPGIGAQVNPVIVATSDLLKRYKLWVAMDYLRNDGKTNKSGNKVQLKQRPNLSTPYEAPVTDLEKNIADIFEKTLGIAAVGRKDNIFDLGANSLLNIQLASKIREGFNVDIGIEKLLAHQSVSEISDFILSMDNKGLMKNGNQ